MSEQITNLDGTLTVEEEISRDVQRIQNSFAHLEFGSGRPINLPEGDKVEPMLAVNEDGASVPVVRWRRNWFNPESNSIEREDLYAFIGGVSGNSLLVFHDDFTHEDKMIERGHGDQIVPRRQEFVSHLISEQGGREAGLQEVRAIMIAANMAVKKSLAAA